MADAGFIYHEPAQVGHRPLKTWTRGVPIEDGALKQLRNIASLPFVHHHVAAMPDVHWGMGATVGSVIATRGAIIPAAVGVDIGCGMVAVQTTLTAADLPDSLAGIRTEIERAVPHGTGFSGNWGNPPAAAIQAWERLEFGYVTALNVAPKVDRRDCHPTTQLGTLGGGNHFVELCLDETDVVWVMIHSGSRGVGNRIGSHFINLAKAEMRRWFVNLPDEDLAYLPEGSVHFQNYIDAVSWAQNYARLNREVMIQRVLDVLRQHIKPFDAVKAAINCHHNYVDRENHFGENVLVTRKGAVRAREGDLGIIPGSMGAKSFIVRGRGNADSFHSCSHGAGRAMSRGEARRRISLEQHAAATAGIECRKDAEVLDESPAAYKDIDAVMAAQTDLVEVLFTLRQVICVKG